MHKLIVNTYRVCLSILTLILNRALPFCMLLPIASAQAQDQLQEDIKIYYRDGTRIESFDRGFELRVRTMAQFLYEYVNFENSENSQRQVQSSFINKWVRLTTEGRAYNYRLSYKLETQFADNMRSEALRTTRTGLADAWLRWNFTEYLSAKAGRFRVPYSRSFTQNDGLLQFSARPRLYLFLTPNRNQGSSLHYRRDGIELEAGLFNGNSDGEMGAGIDTNMLGAFSASYSSSKFGSRKYAGIPRYIPTFEWTTGVSGTAEQGTQAESSFSRYRANADVGVRTKGYSLQSEVYFDVIDSDLESAQESFGAYIQGSSFISGHEWELAGRLGYFDSNQTIAPVQRQKEYGFIVTRYLMENQFRVQSGLTFLDDLAPSNESFSNYKVHFLVALYF